MNLLDHFRPPLASSRHWEGFHARWAVSLVDSVNRAPLPKHYFAEAQVHIGGRVEVDVATFEDQRGESEPRETAIDGGSGGGTATLAAPVWAPPQSFWSMPAIFPDSIEVLVYNSQAGPTVVGAIELISPGNKDRPEFRRGFAAKCAALLQQGIGLVMIDIVTDRSGNLHNELVRLLEAGDAFVPSSEILYATSYQPRRRPARDEIRVWPAELGVGRPLPVVPLPLDKGLILPLDLGATYTESCQLSRITGE